MNNSDSTNPRNSHDAQSAQSSLWQHLKGKNIAYLTLPLLFMATVVEFVILATGWKYQQAVCLPQGMGVTFFGIGPIGATILAVELLKLPLAIWTASRTGWAKGVMLWMGLPLICLLTFQLVKDMAVYEMGTAMAPAGEMLEKATAEEVKIAQLNAELENQTKDDGAVKNVIEEKKAERDRKRLDLAAKQAKAKADLEESLKRNEATRTDAITLTDYQKKELSEVEVRQATLIKQFDADAATLSKSIAELRTRREAELGRATTWNAEEALLENAYKAKLADYTNRKTAYEKDKAAYDGANFLRRQLMKVPVDPGVPPDREANKILKPTLIAELEAQIKAKEDELLTVNNKRRDGVTQVGADARRLREDFDRRSGTKREETDRKREELTAALAALVLAGTVESKQIDDAFEASVQKEQDTLKNQRPVEVVRAELDASRKNADGFYEAREASIKNTQVHRIATTVEIVRGWFLGERPLSVKASAKERGDVYTDQISMVRIWVYPVLAFIVAFLPTLMVEIGFSTLFKPEQQRPPHRLGFFGRGLHWLYIRAGRQKILRAERLASTASAEISARDRALASAQAAAQKALSEKDAELRTTREALVDSAAQLQEQLATTESQHAEELQRKEDEWVAKFGGLADSLNRAIIEKDALRDLQKSEVERQIQMRQHAWSDRITALHQELDEQRTASETERTALLQEHHQKLLEVTEDSKTQVIMARRQMTEAELTAVESTAKLAHDVKEALHARDAAEAQLKNQSETLALRLNQAQEESARELEKALRHEKQRFDRQQVEFSKTLRERGEEFERQLKQREQELSLVLDARIVEEQSRVEQEARRREAELQRQSDARVRETEARWKQEAQQREDAAQVRLKQREQQLQAQGEARLSEAESQAEKDFRRRESELERQLDALSRDADTRAKQESQQKELAFHAKLKQRELELAASANIRETELQNQWAADLRSREEEWNRQAESRARAIETRLTQEVQQKEEMFQIKLRQREQQLQAQLDARQSELKGQWEQELRALEQEWERKADANVRATESRLLADQQQKEEMFQSKTRQRDQQWQVKLDAARAELQAQTDQDLRLRESDSAEARQRALRELETSLRQEMEEKAEATQTKARQREQELLAQIAAEALAHQQSAQELETELEITRSAIEPFKVILARTEKERDEAVQAASASVREVQDMEKKLSEASSLLTGWKHGKNLAPARVGRETYHVGRGVMAPPEEA